MPWMVISPPRPMAGAGQNLTLGASSVQSTTFPTGVQMISVTATGNCHVAINSNPTAAATDLLVMSTDPPVILKVVPGDKIAVIRDGTATGTLNVVPMTY